MAHTQAETRLPLAGGMLLSSLADNWWLLLLRGLAAIAFGILAFFWPGLTLLTLILLWGVYALCDGVFALGAALFAKGGDMAPRWWLALVGIIIGLLQIWGAIEWRNVLDDAWLLALNGVLAAAFGALLLARPGAGAVALVWMIGWFAVVFGCLNVALSFRLKKFKTAGITRS